MIEELLCDYCHRNMRDRRSDWCPMLHDTIWNKIALKDEVLHLSCAETLLGEPISRKHLRHCPFNVLGAFHTRPTLGIPWNHFTKKELRWAVEESIPLQNAIFYGRFKYREI